MSTLGSLPREVLKWLLSLDLSYTVRHIKRDFSNGFLFAEILSRYYPADIQMHSFENVTSIERKKANWVVLEKLFRKRGIPIDQQQIEAVINAEGDAAGEVLQSIYSFINSDAYRESLADPIPQQQIGAGRDSPARQQPYRQQQSFRRQPSFGQLQQQQQPLTRSKSNGREAETAAAAITGYCYGSDGQLYPMFAGSHDAQQMWQQQVDPAYIQQMQAYAQMYSALGVAPDGTLLAAGSDPTAGGSNGGLEDLAFSKKPRQVEYQPYKQADYEAKNYDVKKAGGYWQLGKMGAADTPEVQEKREAREKIKELGKRINDDNLQRLAAAGPARAKAKQPSSRDRAAEYAKTSVPRPETLRQRTTSVKQFSSKGSRNASDAGSGSGADELEQLTQQHEAYAEEVERIRQELESVLGAGQS